VRGGKNGGAFVAAAARRCAVGWVGDRRSRRDHHAGHEDVLVDGGAGGAGGDARRVVLGLLFELDLLVPAIGAAEGLLAPARAQGKIVQCRSFFLNSDAGNNYSGQPNNAH